jgi:hypothetical protein
MSALVALVRSAAVHQLARHVEEHVELADGILLAAEAPILDWLLESSSTIVLPSAVSEPAVEVLRDIIQVEGLGIEIVLTAWDQLGMAPLELVQRGSPLRLALNYDVCAAIDGLDIEEKNALGIDLFLHHDHSRARGFPSALNSSSGERATAIGAVIASHNSAPHRINIHTAAAPLLQAASRMAAIDGVEVVLAARDKAQRSSMGRSSAPSQDGHDVLLVEESDMWAFRIDIAVGEVHRSWWCVYSRATKDGAAQRRESWSCIQRLLIVE